MQYVCPFSLLLIAATALMLFCTPAVGLDTAATDDTWDDDGNFAGLVTPALPSAMAGTAISRRAMRLFAQEDAGAPFFGEVLKPKGFSDKVEGPAGGAKGSKKNARPTYQTFNPAINSLSVPKDVTAVSTSADSANNTMSAAAVTASYTQLKVSRDLCESRGGTVWFAASWKDYWTNTWKTTGYWQLPVGRTVYFGDSTNRYFYIYAYSFAQNGLDTCWPSSPSSSCCYPGSSTGVGSSCCPLYWTGSTYLQLDSGRVLPFFQKDFGPTIITSFTTRLSCSCATRFCITGPCCQCPA